MLIRNLLILALALPLGAIGQVSDVANIVPAVHSWKAAEGSLRVSAIALEAAPANAETLKPAAAAIREDLAALLGDSTRGGKPVTMLLALDTADPKRPEAYTVEITDKIVIRGTTPAAVFLGSRSVLQLLRQSSDLPKGTINDWPDYRGRMLMLDVGRKPYPLPALKDFIRLMAWYKMNELHLHLSDEAFGGTYTAFRVESKTFPGLAAKDLFYTAADLRDLQDFAKARGIVITPEIDMPGHARCFTNYWPEITLKDHPNYMDVTNPKTIEVMKQLLDEMIPLFDAPDFHIGTDEYRVDGPRKEELHESFRQFINTMNAHVRSRGKNTRIWSGFEHMGGTTEIDPTVIIDMWETDDAKGQIAKGHPIINSNHGRTYLVPGAHYYGISRSGIYQGWEPWMVSGDMTKNPAKDDPKLLGGKLHVWFDQGPTGWTLTEVGENTLSGIHAFSEKLWGTKGSADYPAFTKRAEKTLPVPAVTLLDRLPVGKEGVILDLPREVELKDESSMIPLPLAKAERADLESPWTLTMEIRRRGLSKGRGVILSSDLAEICANYSRQEEITETDPNGSKSKKKLTFQGISTLRAAGTREGDGTPGKTRVAHDTAKSSDKQLPDGQWATLTVVGEPGRNTIWLNGEKIAESGNQLVCPLRQLGGGAGESFVGTIRKLRVVNRALMPKEIGRAAGLDIPDNLAAGAKVTATVSDTAHGFTPELATDDDLKSRWSSGPTQAEQSLALDLGKAVAFNTVAIEWEAAVPADYRVEVSADGKQWKPVFTGAAQPGRTSASFPNTKGRQVRIVMSKPTTPWGYSIHNVEVLEAKSPAGKK
ncbi:family 20 glycosylhydrolase [Haloferula sp. BvORR071]|uniref:family 20 glycosylhydrolase n=1 Tax=Haloferula sp. BvORR071 TaxID=1396141 RepID=UPI0005549863|nr:family 20 glycosylhydrolase [Haloferula sp. BvORR071]